RDRTGAPNVIIVNQALAHNLWPDQDPIGRGLRLRPLGPNSLDLTFVGVVGDVKSAGLEAPTPLEIYIPYLQFGPAVAPVVVRSRGGAMAVGAAVRRAVESLDPNLPLFDVQPLATVLLETV